jgi:hypothetical protein
MSYENFQTGQRFLASSTLELAAMGITVSIGSDFDAYKEILRQERPEQEIGAPFDPDLYDLNSKNAFWMIGRNQNGQVMHTQAMRLLDLQQGTLGEYLRSGFRNFPPACDNLDLPRSRYRAGPGASRMRGRTCYHGEFWIGGEPGEYRGKGLASVLGRYGFMEALNRLDPDHVFGFMQRAVAFKGFAERHGYMHSEPGALRWYLNGVDKPIEGFMVYMNREDLEFILEMPTEELVAFAA